MGALRLIVSGVIALALGLAGAREVPAQSTAIGPGPGSAATRPPSGSPSGFLTSPPGSRPVKSPSGGGTAPAGTGFSTPGRGGGASGSGPPPSFHAAPPQSQETPLSRSGVPIGTPAVSLPE